MLEPLLLFFIVTALLFDFLNGFHDSANVVATVIASRAMSPRVALSLSALTNFIGPFLFGVAVATTIGTEVVSEEAEIAQPAVSEQEVSGEKPAEEIENVDISGLGSEKMEEETPIASKPQEKEGSEEELSDEEFQNFLKESGISPAPGEEKPKEEAAASEEISQEAAVPEAEKVQAVEEVAESVVLVYDRHPEYRNAKIFERIIV